MPITSNRVIGFFVAKGYVNVSKQTRIRNIFPAKFSDFWLRTQRPFWPAGCVWPGMFAPAN
jgi:hypothetical protein